MEQNYKDVELPLKLTAREDFHYKCANMKEEKYIIFDTLGIKGSSKEKASLYITLEKVGAEWVYVSSGY